MLALFERSSKSFDFEMLVLQAENIQQDVEGYMETHTGFIALWLVAKSYPTGRVLFKSGDASAT